MGLLTNYYGIKAAAGLTVQTDREGQVAIALCQVFVNGKTLEIEKKHTGIKSMAELNGKLALGVPIALNLTGKGIIYKRLNNAATISSQNFSTVLPGSNFDDFVVQQFVSGDYSFIAVMRKADAWNVIDQVQKQGFEVLIVSLGPFAAYNILDQLNVYGETVIFDGHQINRNEDLTWADYTYDAESRTSFQLKIEVETIEESLVLPYANAFQLALAGKLEIIKSEMPEMEVKLADVLTTRKLKVHGVVVAIGFFMVLLANFLTLSWLNADNTRLFAQVSQTARTSTDMEGLNNVVREREALLKGLGWDGGINKGKLIGQVAALLPPGVQWTELLVNPIDNASRKDLHFVDRSIRISGKSAQIMPVNEWIAMIKTKKWVKGVQLQSYRYDQENNTGLFTIIISY